MVKFGPDGDIFTIEGWLGMAWWDRNPPASVANPDLVLAQFKSLSRQAPLIYVIALIGGWSLVFSHRFVAPDWALIYYPVFVTVISIVRGIGWYRIRSKEVSVLEAKKHLERAHAMAIVSPFLFGFWGFSLFPYGDIALQAQVIFTVCVGTVVCMSCVLHLRSAMIIGVFCINAIGLSYFLVFDAYDHIAIYLCSVAFSIALMAIYRNYYEDFIQLVAASQQLKSKQTQLEVKAAETTRLARENEKLANHDALTGLPNRRFVFSTLEEKCEASHKSGGKLALCIFDLGGFKSLNNLFGHVAGDSLLLQVGTRLRSKAGSGFIGRLGGDEFCMIIENAADDNDIERIGRGVLEIFTAPFLVPGGGVSLSGFVGLSILEPGITSSSLLYENAAFALKVAKRKPGRNFILFGEEQRDEMRETVLLERTLMNADLHAEMSLEYQPIIDIQTQKISGFEGLARWNSPELGAVSPGAFIPVAEHSGYISQLTGFLLKKALADAKTWPKDMSLSFNLSPTNLSSPEVVAQLLNIVKQSGFEPDRLVFEITETAVMRDFDQALAAVKSLKKTGVGIALDDFGTGFSSLRHMHELPLDKIKVDRSFVHGITTDATSYGIVKSLLTLSRDMHIECVVEGVETTAELETVREIGGQLVQGFLLERPMKLEAIPACIERFKRRQHNHWLAFPNEDEKASRATLN